MPVTACTISLPAAPQHRQANSRCVPHDLSAAQHRSGGSLQRLGLPRGERSAGLRSRSCARRQGLQVRVARCRLVCSCRQRARVRAQRRQRSPATRALSCSWKMLLHSAHDTQNIVPTACCLAYAKVGTHLSQDHHHVATILAYSKTFSFGPACWPAAAGPRLYARTQVPTVERRVPARRISSSHTRANARSRNPRSALPAAATARPAATQRASPSQGSPSGAPRAPRSTTLRAAQPVACRVSWEGKPCDTAVLGCHEDLKHPAGG